VQPFKYVLDEPPKKAGANGAKEVDKAGKSKIDEMTEAVRDLKISWIPKLGNHVMT